MIPPLVFQPLSEPHLEAALRRILTRAAAEETYAALVDELRRLYTAAGEPIPPVIRPPYDYADTDPDERYAIRLFHEMLH